MMLRKRITDTSLYKLNHVSIPSSHIRTLLFFQKRLQSTTATLAAINTKNLVKSYNDSTIPDLPFRWFYAIDVPISMPPEYKYTKTETPKKFSEFSVRDSKNLERAYQKLLHDKEVALKDNLHKVPVNEDFLFEVDLTTRKLYPVYWSGAVYEVRRGTWFTDEGQPLRESLADELEKGFLELRPFEQISEEQKDLSSSNPLNKRSDYYTLEGFDEGKIVIYGEERTACILEELAGGTFQLNLLKKLESGPVLGGVRVHRGFQKAIVEKNKASAKKDTLSSLFELELSQLIGDKSGLGTKKSSDENTMSAMAIEIDEDYKEDEQVEDETNEREVDHLIFCVHGIGQVLGTKFQGVNFVHTVNMLRKNIKSVYQQNTDLQSLLSNDKNCRIQVLPITWRHKVEFKTDEAAPDLDENGKQRLPSLLDITVNEIKPMRNLLGSVVLDVLLYYEPRYYDAIIEEVVKQANEVYALYKKRNPKFKGKVSFIGHSLGSAISFDILSVQPSVVPQVPHNPKHLTFPVSNYFAIGSPIGVFNLLKKKNIGSRELNGESTETISTPRVENFYNVFHPCDPVGYRCEPLISPEFKDYQPESVPFLIEDFNKQITSLTQLGETLQSKVISNANDAWRTLTSSIIGSSKVSKDVKEISEANLKKDEDKKDSEKTSEGQENEAKDENTPKKRSIELGEEQLKKLTNLNYNGRVDYALTQGLFDFSIVSAISAHVSYFEDENTAAFILRETLTQHDRVLKKKVRLVQP